MESDLPADLQRSPDGGRWTSYMSALPEKLQQRLMPFQKEGVAFALSRDGRCMIADEMGLGKTVQAISVAYCYRQEWPLLIVVPSSLKYPWMEEMERWIPELNPRDINLVESKSDITGISTSKVTVLGYGLLTTDARPLVEALTRQKFAVVVVDESHYLKSKNAARSKILVPLIQSAKRAILLTGTPALGRPEELFTQIDSLYPKKFGTWSDYTKQYCNAHYRFFGNRRQWDCRGASHLEELHQRLSEIMIRRLKTQVLTQLPPKIRQRIPFDLPKEAAKEACASLEEWERLMKTLGSRVSAPDPEGNPFTQVMGAITRMYKQTAIAKAGPVKDYIKMLLESDQLKFLVFAHHLTMLQACTEAVIEAKAGYIRIDGSVPSSERVQLVHQFQNDPGTRVAILSIQAAGQGLTFTAATHVVFAELYWNPGHVKQAEDRAHRIGQSASVHVHYLIAKGTFDTVMWGMLNRKETVTGSTLNGRKEYLNAEVGDKDKWDFLNFSSAWTPSLAPLGGDPDADEDGVFFSHFEKDKQRDIRSFFSPNTAKDKKRRRSQREERSLEGGEARPAAEEEQKHPVSPADSPPDEDFSPQVKRLRTPGPSPRSRLEAKRRSCPGRSGPLSPLFVPRRLSERAPPRLEGAGQGGVWSCGACTYSNSTLLPYCEVCEAPRLTSEPPASTSEPRTRDQPNQDPPPGPASPTAPEPHADPLQPEEEERPGGRQAAGDHPSAICDHTEDRTCASTQSAEDDSTDLPLYPNLRFCASKNTDRVYLYTKEDTPMNCNFIPLDISLDNWEDLPPAFRRRENRSQVLRFVREWTTLTAMKQRLLRRSGQLFQSPILAVDELARAQRKHSTKRYLRREDVAEASLSKARQDGGSVRVVAPDRFFRRAAAPQSSPSSAPQPSPSCAPSPFSAPQPSPSGTPQPSPFSALQPSPFSAPQPSPSGAPQPSPSGAPQPSPSGGPQPSPSSAPHRESVAPAPPAGGAPEQGYLQAVDSAGVPLCLSCHKPCPPDPEARADSRFCSQACLEDFQLRSSQAHMRARVLQAEQGACQHCGLQAHQLYLRVRDAPPPLRKDILEGTWLEQLPLKQLNEMIRNPVEGHFWQVDHIRPVYSGGGQCSLDNLQTLCTVCHRTRTAQQAKERSHMRRGLSAGKVASDITRFFIKK